MSELLNKLNQQATSLLKKIYSTDHFCQGDVVRMPIFRLLNQLTLDEQGGFLPQRSLDQAEIDCWQELVSQTDQNPEDPLVKAAEDLLKSGDLELPAPASLQDLQDWAPDQIGALLHEVPFESRPVSLSVTHDG